MRADSPRRVRADETRSRIVAVATRLFAVRGFHGTALEDLVAEAGVTRGALYHHFGSKEGLFLAVVEEAHRGVAARIDAAVAVDGESLPLFLDGCRAFLEASLDPAVRRILLVDGPVVIGWDAWRSGDLGTSARLLREGIDELIAEGIVAVDAPEVLTAMLSGALNEIAIEAARADDPSRVVEQAVALAGRILDAARPVD